MILMPTVSIYSDEVLKPKKGENYNYIILGMLIVEERNKKPVLRLLNNSRCLNEHNFVWYDNFEDCPNKDKCKKEFHEENKTKIHFTEIRRNRVRKNIALKWIKSLKWDLADLFNFHLLVIDLNKLNSKEFGQTNIDMNIYNRFFRTLVKGGLKRHYPAENRLYINNIYHHQGSQEKHQFFPELNMKKLSFETRSDSIYVKDNKIVFLDGDHRKYEDKENSDNSQLIQLIDCILGSFSQLLMNLSDKEGHKEVAELSRSIFNKSIGKDWNYPYSVSVFPRFSYQEMFSIGQMALQDFVYTGEYELLDMAIDFSQGNIKNFHSDIKFSMPPFVKEVNNLNSWLK